MLIPMKSILLQTSKTDLFSFPQGSFPVLYGIPLCLFQFKPLEQLMGVFPAASGKFLPPTWRELMSNPVSIVTSERVPGVSKKKNRNGGGEGVNHLPPASP